MSVSFLRPLAGRRVKHKELSAERNRRRPTLLALFWVFVAFLNQYRYTMRRSL